MADGEIEKVRRLIERGATQYLLVTNVAGTAHLDVGSIDRLHAELTSKLGIPVQCWWRDDLNRRLDGSWDVKLRYPEVLSGQDFLRLLLNSAAGQEQERRRRAISAFLAHQYADDVEVKFKQVELHNKLLDLFVDLPFRLMLRSDEGKARDFAASFGLRMLPSFGTKTYALEDISAEGGGTATLLLGDAGQDKLGQVVVEGAPGQGKSTLAQYICQVHRIRWLRKVSEFAQLPEHHRHTPLRFPIKVDLRDLASWLSNNDPFDAAAKVTSVEEKTLEAFLARLVKYRSGGIEFDVNDLLEVARSVPPLIVLDGLDEVADLKGRAEVVAAVSKAAQRLRENCPAIRLVVTSRPAAFANSPGFDSEDFPHVELGSVTRSQIETYAARWLQVRNLDPKEQAEFQSVLDEKMEQPHLRDLARNPMQLAILLSLIHSRGAALPDKRTHLYDTYVEIFFSREAGKSTVVRRRLELLKDIHRYLAWILHSEAETGKGHASGRISTSDLKALLRGYLQRERHDTAIVEEVFGAMLERVVMIVSRIEGTYEFEVQPLREYFAARYLYDTAPYSPPGGEASGTKPDRFDAIARNYYWLNVTRFFCGCFSKGELLDLADRVKELTLDPMLGKTRHPATLAAMLSSDWVFAQAPRAVAEVATALSSQEAIRRLLPVHIHYRDAETIQIPIECGGSTVIESAFSMLENENTRADLGLRLAEFVRANLTPNALQQRWISSATDALAGNTARWLWVGQQLNTLHWVERSEILAALGSGPLDAGLVGLFSDAGRYDCLNTSEANVEALMSQILDVPIWRRSNRNSGAPLHLLPTILSLPNSWIYGRGIVNEFILEVVRQFEAEAENVMPSLLPSHIEGSILSVSHKFSAVIKATVEGSISAEGMEDVIEECRSNWGERRSIIASACAIVHLPRRSAAHRAPIDLFDRSISLCKRLRYARARAKDAAWWTRQARGMHQADDRFLFYLAFWIWAGNTVLADMADEIADALEQLPDAEWHGLLEFVQPLVERLAVTRSDAPATWPASLSSPRFALLVAFREQASMGRSIFLKHFVQDGSGHSRIAEFRQAGAFEAALAGVLDWERALLIIRSTYADGAWSRIMRVRSDGPRRAALPEAVAKQVLEAPGDYPVYLWELAESRSALKARKAIKAVGLIARKEKWFAA